MTSLPFLIRLIAATILAQQNKTLIAEIAYLRTEIGFLREPLPAWTRKPPDSSTITGSFAFNVIDGISTNPTSPVLTPCSRCPRRSRQ